METTERSNCSCYCDYNEVFTAYDRLRQPVGLQEILEGFEQTGIPLKEMVVLEGGFGTGAYMDHMRHHVREIHGVEGSEEGLKKALQKMGQAPNVRLQIGNILHLPFAAETFHAYMVNQVLHHLDTEPDYPNLDLFLKESMRVLKPGGVLTIHTCSHEQLDPHSGVFWNFKYIETAAHALKSRYIPVEALMARMARCRFTDIHVALSSGKIFHERYYRDPRIALEPEFQKGDSVYCFLSEEERDRAHARICVAIEDGSIHKEMKRAAARADEIGEALLISGRKPA